MSLANRAKEATRGEMRGGERDGGAGGQWLATHEMRRRAVAAMPPVACSCIMSSCFNLSANLSC